MRFSVKKAKNMLKYYELYDNIFSVGLSLNTCKYVLEMKLTLWRVPSGAEGLSQGK